MHEHQVYMCVHKGLLYSGLCVYRGVLYIPRRIFLCLCTFVYMALFISVYMDILLVHTCEYACEFGVCVQGKSCR